LTVIDLRLDRNIATQYRLARQLAWSFADDHRFAWGLHINDLNYDPDNPDWQKLRSENPSEYWRQGLPYGRLDNAVEALVIRDHEPDGSLRIRSFGEFESALHQNGVVAENFAIVRDIFLGFHPAARPVLWRMLIAQAHIYESVIQFQRGGHTSGAIVVTPISPKDRERFYWERVRNPSDRERMEQPFAVAEGYLARDLPELWSSLK